MGVGVACRMYMKTTLVDTVRVPPERLGDVLEEVILDSLQDSLEGRIDKTLGAIVAVTDIVEIGEGHILSGDGAVYYDVTFNAVVYKPVMQEIVEGIVVETVEFGAFVGLGPLDGLLHVSQITDGYVSYDGKNARLVCKEDNRALGEGDGLRARIVAISIKEKEPKESKIGLTMRQPALGKLEWLEEDRTKAKEGKSDTREE